MLTDKQSLIRITMRQDGVLVILDKLRNFAHEIYPFERNRVDDSGVSAVVKSVVPKLSDHDVFKVLKRLETLDESGQVNWNETYNYLYSLFNSRK